MLNTPRITRELLRSWGACYSGFQLDECFGDLTELTLVDVLDLPIELEDRIWVFKRALPTSTLAEIACCIAELVLPYFEAQWPQTDLARKVIDRQRGLMRGEVLEQDVTTSSRALAAFIRAEYLTGTSYVHPAMRAGCAAAGVTGRDVCLGTDNATVLDVYLDARAAVRSAAKRAQPPVDVRGPSQTFEAAVQQIIRRFLAPAGLNDNAQEVGP